MELPNRMDLEGLLPAVSSNSVSSSDFILVLSFLSWSLVDGKALVVSFSGYSSASCFCLLSSRFLLSSASSSLTSSTRVTFEGLLMSPQSCLQYYHHLLHLTFEWKSLLPWVYLYGHLLLSSGDMGTITWASSCLIGMLICFPKIWKPPGWVVTM